MDGNTWSRKGLCLYSDSLHMHDDDALPQHSESPPTSCSNQDAIDPGPIHLEDCFLVMLRRFVVLFASAVAAADSASAAPSVALRLARRGVTLTVRFFDALGAPEAPNGPGVSWS